MNEVSCTISVVDFFNKVDWCGTEDDDCDNCDNCDDSDDNNNSSSNH